MAEAAQASQAKKKTPCGFLRGRQPKQRPRQIVTYKFVAMVDHHRIEEWKALGWKFREPNTPTRHDEYGLVGEYISDRDEEPPTPNMPVLR